MSDRAATEPAETGGAAVIDDLAARGLIQDHTDLDGLRARLASGPVRLYHGIDPTAASLHTGNLIGLLVLRRFHDAGHRPIALAGGATGMVGDPSGRSSERNLLDDETLDANLVAISGQITRLLGEVPLVDNREWTAPLTLLTFLRDVGKHVTVNTMLARESVRSRMGSGDGISFTEFSYMLLQANDFLHLADERGVELQVGGSDQWGNIVAGVDLIRRVRGRAVHALSWPLITGPDGSKLGKTTGARVWLDPDRTSPYRFYQHWMQTDDRQVHRFLAQFTLLPVAEIETLMADHERAPERRAAQRRLADEVTTLVHGAAAWGAAAEASALLFGGDPTGASADALRTLEVEVPTLTVAGSRLDAGLELAAVAAEAGLTASKGEARRLLQQRGLSVNGARADGDRLLARADLIHGRYILLRRGRRDHALVVLAAGE